MNQSDYAQIKIEKKAFPFVYNILENNVIKECFKHNMWIAGGFSRKIGRIVLGLDKHDKNSKKSILKYFKQNGDIDFFSDRLSNVNTVYRKVSENYCAAQDHWEFNENSKLKSKNLTEPDFPWLSPFANNVDIKRLNATIQLVNKFNFNTIEECLDSFDLLNCRYAIYKKGSNYFLVYDKKLLSWEKKNSLVLCHSKTPFLGNRIVKYMRKHDMSFADTKDNINVFEEYLYKMSANIWKEEVDIEISDMNIGSTIKNLHRTSSLSPNQLSLFIGKISANVADEVKTLRGSYGIFTCTTYKNVDWATNEISGCANFV